ncbi:MAG: class I adenylate-forming enzyme family protein [Acidimicrobiales bacterium]
MNVADLLLARRPMLLDARGEGAAIDLRSLVAARRAVVAEATAVGERVVIGVADPAEAVAWYVATVAEGRVAVPIGPRLPDAERRRLLDAIEAADASALVIDDETAPPTPTPGVDLAATEVEADAVAALLFTSGTEGAPRAVPLRHRHLRAALATIGAIDVGLGPDDRFGLVVPTDHVLGLSGVVNLCLATGATLVVGLDPRPVALADAVRRHDITVLAGPPTLWHDLVTARVGALEPVRIALSGAAPLDAELGRRVADDLGVVLHQAYGLTETVGMGASTLGAGDDAEQLAAAGSVGRLLPGVEARLVGEDGADVLVGDAGELLLRGPTVALTDPADGWLHTGDLAVVDDTGALSIVDRLKDLVIVSGFNVHPGEVERVLRAAPGVAEAGVIAAPDPRTGERVEALVVAEADVTVDIDAVLAHCRSQLARYKVPSSIEVVDSLPTTALGKLQRGVLRKS